jgi:YbbR domain-containing protein
VNLRTVRNLLLENWGLKLVSLAFAILLWMFVVGEKRSEVSLSVPLELTRVPQDMVIVSRVPEDIRIRLNGPRTLLATVNPQQIAVSLDLDGVQPGISAFEILPSRFNLPRGIEVTYISPSVITLEADLKVRKTVPVKPRIKGTPAEGYEVAEVRAEPPQLEVEGAERAVKQLKEAPTEVVDVSGLQGSVTRPVELALPDPSLRPVDRKPVRIEVVIRELKAEREFLAVPVGVPTQGWRIQPPTVDVKVSGSVRAISSLGADAVKAAVEPMGAATVPGNLQVTVTAPPGIQVVSVTPDRVRAERVPENPTPPPASANPNPIRPGVAE